MPPPLVSLCMPTYNGAKYVGEAVDSALRQTADPATLELVVSDSGSTDDTLDRIRHAAKGSPFPVRILDTRTPGMVANWNAVTAAARGRYVKYLFQDDRLAPTCVEKMAAVAVANPNVSLVFARRELLVDDDAAGLPTASLIKQIDNVHRHWRRLRPLQPGVDLLGDRALLVNPTNKVGEPTVVLADRQKMIAVGPFNLRMKQLVDLEMWLRLMAVGDVAFIDESLASFRVHAGQMTAKNLDADTPRAEWAALYDRLSQPDLYPLLHVAARYTVRKHAEATSRTHVPAGVTDRAYAAARGAVHLGRKLRGG